MSRERDEELLGDVSIDEYTEVKRSQCFSVFSPNGENDGSDEFFAYWAKMNAQENAKIDDTENAEKVAKICKVTVSKYGQLWIGCYDENETKFVNFFVKPAIAISVFKKPVVKREYTTTPQGRKIPTGWNWLDDETLNDTLKDLSVVYNVKEVKKGDKVVEEKIILEVF